MLPAYAPPDHPDNMPLPDPIAGANAWHAPAFIMIIQQIFFKDKRVFFE
jgi:hypothetical protein